MLRFLREIVWLLAGLSLSIIASGQSTTSSFDQRDSGVRCVTVQALSPKEPPTIIDFCHGVAVLDAAGEAQIMLPGGFDFSSRDFRYQLTPIGQPSPDLHLTGEMTENIFSITGGRMKQKVSWQVVATRSYKQTNLRDGIRMQLRRTER